MSTSSSSCIRVFNVGSSLFSNCDIINKNLAFLLCFMSCSASFIGFFCDIFRFESSILSSCNSLVGIIIKFSTSSFKRGIRMSSSDFISSPDLFVIIKSPSSVSCNPSLVLFDFIIVSSNSLFGISTGLSSSGFYSFSSCGSCWFAFFCIFFVIRKTFRFSLKFFQIRFILLINLSPVSSGVSLTQSVVLSLSPIASQ